MPSVKPKPNAVRSARIHREKANARRRTDSGATVQGSPNRSSRICREQTGAIPFSRILARLEAAWGPQGWWPGRTRLEVMVGAVLTQNTAWRNVERAIAGLRGAGLLSYRALRDCREAELAEAIHPAGTYRIKAARLKALLGWLDRTCRGDFTRLFRRPTGELQRDLLAVPGIGPETADCILLYAGGHPVFVVDAYSRRVLARHGWIGAATPDADVAAMAERALANRPRMARVRAFNELHALLVRLGKEHCRTRPRCDGCPLAPLLPAGGPA